MTSQLIVLATIYQLGVFAPLTTSIIMWGIVAGYRRSAPTDKRLHHLVLLSDVWSRLGPSSRRHLLATRLLCIWVVYTDRVGWRLEELSEVSLSVCTILLSDAAVMYSSSAAAINRRSNCLLLRWCVAKYVLLTWIFVASISRCTAASRHILDVDDDDDGAVSPSLEVTSSATPGGERRTDRRNNLFANGLGKRSSQFVSSTMCTKSCW